MNPALKIKDIQALLAGGPLAVEFGPQIEDAEAYPEPGMRAVAQLYQSHDPEGCHITFDFGAFDAHNLALEKANYYDKSGNATLTARQANHYKPVDTVYFDPEAEMAPWFTPLDSPRLKLMTEFSQSAAAKPQTYVRWLEDRVLSAQA